MKDNNLSHLYDLLVQELTEKIKRGEASAADLSVARQLLKDANLDTTLETNPDMKNLIESLPFSDD